MGVKTKIQGWLLSELQKGYIAAFKSLNEKLVIWAHKDKTPDVCYPPVKVHFIDASIVEITPVPIYPIEIQDSWVQDCIDKAQRLGSIKHSIRCGLGNFIGYLGEYVFANTLKYPIVSDFSYDYDVFTPHFDIDVKTKECSVVPQDYYSCSIKEPEKGKKYQQCQIYAFVRCKQKQGCEAWLLGYLFRDEFLQIAFKGVEGELEDTPGGNADYFKYRADCLNVLIKDLRKFKKIKMQDGSEIIAF